MHLIRLIIHQNQIPFFLKISVNDSLNQHLLTGIILCLYPVGRYLHDKGLFPIEKFPFAGLFHTLPQGAFDKSFNILIPHCLSHGFCQFSLLHQFFYLSFYLLQTVCPQIIQIFQNRVVNGSSGCSPGRFLFFSHKDRHIVFCRLLLIEGLTFLLHRLLHTLYL